MRTYLPTRVRRGFAAVAVVTLVVSGCASTSSLSAPDEESSADETASAQTEDADGESTEEPPAETQEEPPSEPAAPKVVRPKVGDCVRVSRSDVFLEVLVGVPAPSRCREATGQYASVSDLSAAMRAAATSSDVDTLTDLTATRCRQDVLGWLDTDNEGLEISQFALLPTVPPAASVEDGADFYACTVYGFKRGSKLLELTRSTEGILATNRGRDYDSCARAAITNAGDDTLVCSIAHNWRAVAAARMGEPEERYPGENRLRSRMQEVCEDEVGDYVNAVGTYDYGYTWPTRATWSGDDRFGLCFAKTSD